MREEEVKIESIQKLNKQRKQKLKDDKKKRKKKGINKNTSDKVKKVVPNIKPVPRNCVHLVNAVDVVYTVPGDGSCGPNCASAFLFKDEVFGPKVRRRMNQFTAKHWYKRYQYITQCSEDHPFVRKLGTGEIKYTDPVRLIKYLTHSEKAKHMWTDSEDLAVISDMYQVKIKVITTKGEKDLNPTVNWITPSETLKDFAELKGVDLGEIVLLHQNDLHFDLIVAKDSDLATIGSLSYRSNIGPMVEIDDNDDDIENVDEEVAENHQTSDNLEEEDKTKEMKNLKKEIKKLKENLKALASDYSKCEEELMNKSEEVGKLKIEIRDLKQIVELEKQLEEETGDAHEESLKNEEHIPVKTFRGKKVKHLGPEFNCMECYFQGTNSSELTNHIKLKHKVDQTRTTGSLKCRNCGETFNSKSNLMDHRKDKHLGTVASCKNNLQGTCSFSSKMCWWNHSDQSNEDIIKCYNCGGTFPTQKTMMIHRKTAHTGVIRKCNLFLENRCRYNEDSCWFKHEEVTIEEEEKETSDKDEQYAESVFQKVQENLDPPIEKQEQKKEGNQM